MILMILFCNLERNRISKRKKLLLFEKCEDQIKVNAFILSSDTFHSKFVGLLADVICIVIDGSQTEKINNFCNLNFAFLCDRK